MKPANRQKRILAIGLLVWVALPTWASSQDKIPREVIERAAAQGTAPVLVGLKVPWQMEANLSEDGLHAQRAAIASIQSDLLTHLEGRNYKVVRRYQEIPGIALRVGADALAELGRLPIVTNVLLDQPPEISASDDTSSSRASPDAAGEKVPPDLFKRAATHGTILVIAGLRTPWQREELLTDALLALQRATIQDAQSYLLAELTGTPYRVTRLYRSIPGIALRVGVDALKVLERSPAVTNVIADRPAAAAR
jgi:hypothetical protein